RAGDVSEEGDLGFLTGFSPGGEGDAGAGEGADVHAVDARPVAAVGRFAELDHVGAVGGGDDRGDRVLEQQGGVVVGGEVEALHVHDGHVRVKEGDAQAHPLDLGGDA